MSSWLLEDGSTSTRTNAVYTIDLLLERQRRQQLQQHPGQQEGEQGEQGEQQGEQQGQHLGAAGSSNGGDHSRAPSCSPSISSSDIRSRGSNAGGGDAAPLPGLCVVLVTSPFHQARAHRTFARALAQRGIPLGDGPGAWQLYVAGTPFTGHSDYGAALDAAADQWDWWREVAALCWYAARGWL